MPLCKAAAVRVGILGGTGPLGRGLALRLAAAGSEVVIGSRDAERGASLVAELLASRPDHRLSLTGTGNEEAARGEIVVVATPWEAAVPTARPLAEALAGKVVVSVANALVRQGREMHALVLPRGSVAAGLQAALPLSRVTAAGHHLPADRLADLDDDLRADVLVCGDDEAARDDTAGLIASVPGLRPLHAGSLASASAVEAFTAVLISLNMRYKAHSTLQIVGIDA